MADRILSFLFPIISCIFLLYPYWVMDLVLALRVDDIIDYIVSFDSVMFGVWVQQRPHRYGGMVCSGFLDWSLVLALRFSWCFALFLFIPCSI